MKQSQLRVWLNGEIVDAGEAKVSLFDRGFRLGDGVYESIRTVNGKPFKLEEHVERLFRSLKYLRIDPGFAPASLVSLGYEVAAMNEVFLGPNEDYWLEYNVTRRGPPTALPSRAETIAVFCHPLTFERFNRHYIVGRSLYVPWTRQSLSQVSEPKVKSLSLLHWVLAQLEVYQIDEDAGALVLDLSGNIAEIDGGNFMICKDGRLITPPTREILEGVTRATTLTLASELGLPTEESNLQVYDAVNADEAFITTTSYCIVPITRINGIWVGEGVPGSMWRALMTAWSESIGLDIVGQAIAHLGVDEREALEKEVRSNRESARTGRRESPFPKQAGPLEVGFE